MEDGLRTGQSAFPEGVHVVDLQDGVLLHDAEEDEQPEGGVQVERVVRGPERKQREGKGKRERQEDGERVDEALVLRGEDHVHEHDRQREGPEELAEGAFEFPAAAGHLVGVFGGYVQFINGLAEGREAIGLGIALSRCNSRAQGHHTLAVEAVDAGCGHAGDDLDDIVEADECAGTGRDEQSSEVLAAAAVGGFKAELDVVVVVDLGVAEARDTRVAADKDAEGGGDVGGFDVEGGGARPVDLDAKLGLVET